LFKPMNFMNENKKKIFIKIGAINKDLAFNDADPSFDFIKLYEHSSTKETLFTGSMHAFNGAYGFAHGKLVDTLTKSLGNSDKNLSIKYDIYSAEKANFQDLPYTFVDTPVNNEIYNQKIFKTQKIGFENWKAIQASSNNSIENISKLEEKVQHKLLINKHAVEKLPQLKGKIQVSTSTLKTFYICPRLWLFKNILKIEPLNNESEFIDTYIEGTVNHKIFELYFSALKASGQALNTDAENPERLSEDKQKLLRHLINLAVEAATDPSLKENPSAFYSFGVKNCSVATIKVIQSMYALDEEHNEINPKFLVLEKSIAALCNKWRGYTVYEMEKEVYAFPPDENKKPNPDATFAFTGRIDCILAAPNQSAFTIIDFKTGAMPTPIYCTPPKKGAEEKIIDFQMPMYIYLLENNINEEERIKITNAQFYSIKEQKTSRFCGIDGVEDDKTEKINEANNQAEVAKADFIQRAFDYVEKVETLDFSVNLKHQYPAKCSAKGTYAKCVDYQAVCRRFYTVDGEQL